MSKKKIVVLTGAGMSVESGLRTFRDADGLWEEYPVAQVATHEGWEADPVLVTNFYNMLRKKCWGVKPNEGHKLVAELEKKYDETVGDWHLSRLKTVGDWHLSRLIKNKLCATLFVKSWVKE